MTTAGGYRVQAGGMSGQAGELYGAGDDAGKIREAVAPAQCYTTEALGGTDASAAFNAYATAWEAEVRNLEAALHELGNKVHLAKGAYTGSDSLVDTSVRSVTVGGSVGESVGESHLTTMPASAERPSALTSY